MVCGDQHDEPVAPVDAFVHHRRGHVVREDAYIGAARAERFDHFAAQTFFERDLDAGVGGEKALQVGRKKLHDGRGVGPDPHMTAHAHGKIAHFARHPVDLVEHLQRVTQEPVARRRKFDAAWMTHEEGTIGGPFEVGNALADGRERHMAAFGSAGQAAGFGDRQKDAQRMQIEVRRIDHGAARIQKAGQEARFYGFLPPLIVRCLPAAMVSCLPSASLCLPFG